MKFSLRTMGSVAVVAAVAMATAGTAAVSASEPISVAGPISVTDELPEVPAPRIDDPISEAEMQDLRTIAEQYGMALQAAIERYAWNDNFALAVDQIRQQTPESFTGAAIVDANHAWIGFAGPMPGSATNVIAAFKQFKPNVMVEVRAGLGYTEAALEAAIERVHFAVYDLPEVLDASTSHDPATRVITTTVRLASPASAAELARIRAVASNSLALPGAGPLAGFAAAVVQSSSAVLGGKDSNASHMGGEDLSDSCTSGFGTRADSHTTGTRGISTAGHCDDSLSDDGSNLTFQDDYDGSHGDFQWHTGPKIENDNFYAGSAASTEVNLRDVSGVGLPAVDQMLCKNGITGKKDCQEVRDLDVCNGPNCHLIQMDDRLAASGDSGGPVFYSNTAYGIHTGWMYDPFWPFDRDVFSRGTRIDNGIGVYIATN